MDAIADRTAHRRALATMVLVTLMWSTAGVVTRWLSPQMQTEGRFEITFWRGLFAAIFIGGYLLLWGNGLRALRAAGAPGLLSGAMWAVMFSAFMLALSFTSTANTLLVMSLGPLLTALLARMVLKTPVPLRTWVAIGAAGAGIGWMFAHAAGASGGLGGANLIGMLIAFAVPVASAINLVTLKRTRAHVDLVPAVLIGGVLCALAMLPFALPFQASARDIGLMALLGFFQLGLPCMLMIRASRHLAAPEIALLALLEVLLGPLWAWIGAGEVPARATLYGGVLVLLALVFNEVAGLRGPRFGMRRT